MLKFSTYFLFILIVCASCSDEFLDRNPLDAPSSTTFFADETQLDLALTACYAPLIHKLGNYYNEPVWFYEEGISDNAYLRGSIPLREIAAGTVAAGNSHVLEYWKNCYKGIARANDLLNNMDKAKNVSTSSFNRIKGEALFLRSYYYYKLASVFGDIPLTTKVPETPDQAYTAKTQVNEIVKFIYKDLDSAFNNLPQNAKEKGRVGKGAAYALKARVALFFKDYQVAADAAKTVMDGNYYTLSQDFSNLFTYQGSTNKEIIFSLQYLKGTFEHGLTSMLSPRVYANGFSVIVPSQSFVDAFECTDGLTIDKSPLYDPAHPFANRDPRLGYTCVLPGSRIGDFRYETQRLPSPNDTAKQTWNFALNKYVPNNDVTNPFSSFTGYCYRKYLNSEDFGALLNSSVHYILMRYAEVLLIYAEAKIELNQIDNSVLSAINSLRTRTSVNMPVVTVTDQNELRKIVRRERRVEFGMEGLRYWDLLRWRIAEKALSGPIYGRVENYATQGKPVFDEDGIPDYSAYSSLMRKPETRVFDKNKNYLWPIPTSELTNNKLITENNPGY